MALEIDVKMGTPAAVAAVSRPVVSVSTGNNDAAVLSNEIDNIVVLTQAQYDAIATKNPRTAYFVTEP